VTRIATFVPWQAVESDVGHRLPRFLQALAEREIAVTLLLSPEVGVYFPYSGLPKDLIQREDTLAKHPGQEAVSLALPPQIFALPSLSSPEFLKRYHHFLARMDSLLGDLQRSHPHVLDRVTAVLSGSFWKYYRSPKASSMETFGGPAGDSSSAASLAYRSRVEQFYAQREFTHPNPSAAHRWKTRQMEEVNRRWFQQASEDVFRQRSRQFLRKKARGLRVEQIELFTPEADPAMHYSQLLQGLVGGNGDFARISRVIEDYASRSAMAGGSSGEEAPPWLHLTGLGAFRSLSDSEKQVLILKGLLLMGGRGGGVLMDEMEWFALSPSFRARAESIARSVSDGTLRLENRVYHWVPHLWSNTGVVGEVLRDQLPGEVRTVASMDLLFRDSRAELLFVDPQQVLLREPLAQLLDWARAGKTLVLPRNSLMTQLAREELSETLSGTVQVRVQGGAPIEVQALGAGQVLTYDSAALDLDSSTGAVADPVSGWKKMVQAVLGIAQIQPLCRISDFRLRAVSMHRHDGTLGVFIFNLSSRPVLGDLHFSAEVSVSDLASKLAASQSMPSGDADFQNAGEKAPLSSHFQLEVPPCGVLPISVEGIGESAEDRRLAALSAGLLRQGVFEAASSELAGFDSALPVFGASGSEGGALWS